MSYNQENSIKTPNVEYTLSSVLPLGRQLELRMLLCNFSEDWNNLFVKLYPTEIYKALDEFPEFDIYQLDEPSYSGTVSCKICRALN